MSFSSFCFWAFSQVVLHPLPGSHSFPLFSCFRVVRYYSPSFCSLFNCPYRTAANPRINIHYQALVTGYSSESTQWYCQLVLQGQIPSTQANDSSGRPSSDKRLPLGVPSKSETKILSGPVLTGHQPAAALASGGRRHRWVCGPKRQRRRPPRNPTVGGLPVPARPWKIWGSTQVRIQRREAQRLHRPPSRLHDTELCGGRASRRPGARNTTLTSSRTKPTSRSRSRSRSRCRCRSRRS